MEEDCLLTKLGFSLLSNEVNVDCFPNIEAMDRDLDEVIEHEISAYRVKNIHLLSVLAVLEFFLAARDLLGVESSPCESPVCAD